MVSFAHLGLATTHPDKAKAWLESLGYKPGPPVFDPEQNVTLILCTGGQGPDIEIVYSDDEDSPISVLIKRRGEGVYHLAYETDDLSRALSVIGKNNQRLIPVSPQKPAILFGNRKVSFYHVVGFGLVEFIEV